MNYTHKGTVMTSQRLCGEAKDNGRGSGGSGNDKHQLHTDSNSTYKQTSSKQQLNSIITISCLALIGLLVIVDTTEALTTFGKSTRQGTPQILPATGGKTQQRKVMHPAFSKAGQKPGLEIWRIENFEPVPIPEKDFGKFHTGDSYIILFTKEKSGRKSWDIHFWLGLETSQDESGAAAILTVELDDQLGGSPIQYREVQEHESQTFLSHFKGGIRYLPGGAASGFTHVDPNAFEKRLFQVKGKRNIRVRQVEPSLSSMNKGDCFILDMGKDVYVYVGEKAKRSERLKAITAANTIRDQDHGGRSKIHIIDEFSREEETQAFFDALGSGNRLNVPDESIGGDDETYEKKDEGVSLYRVSDASGSIKYEQVNEKPLKQSSLNTNDCFYLDTVTSGIYAWIGKKCTENEKREVMKKAEEYKKARKYPSWVPVQRIIEGGEPAAFKQYFQNWRDRGELRSRIMKRSVNMEDDNEKRLLKALQKSGGKAQSFMPDNGNGTVEIYRVENFELEPVDQNNYGMFFGGDSYVIKYRCDSTVGEKYIIYFWQGNSSSQDERVSAALHAVRLDNELGGKAMQIRVVQDNEPKHFLSIFKGKMVVFMGGKASGFKNIQDHDTYDVDGTRLFRIRGTSEENVRANQLPEVAASLNSDDVFVLETPNNTYIWNGTGSNEDERTFATNMATFLSPNRNAIILNEGEESDEFWESLGGKGEYEHEYLNHSDEDDIRLFHCHISKRGLLKVEEIVDFTQEDLDEDDVMILDTSDEIYIWIGDQSSSEEKQQVLKLAKKYLQRNPDERNHDGDVIITIKQGEEPESFKELFPSWDSNMWQNQMSYEELKQQVENANNEIED